MTLLGEGELRIEQDGTERLFRVSGGFLQVVRDTVRVVTERAEPPA